MNEPAYNLPVNGANAVYDEPEVIDLNYRPSGTMQQFHDCNAPHRAIIGELGSGKTSTAAIEFGWYIPLDMYRWFGIRKTRGVVVRNTYTELMDTCKATLEEWFPTGRWVGGQKRTFTIVHDCVIDGKKVQLEIEMLLRSCDRPEDTKKFKSLNVLWAWLDESSEIDDRIKKDLRGRVGRYPKGYRDQNTGEWINHAPCKFMVETSNPPDEDEPLYTNYAWNRPPPGPIPEKEPLKGFYGFWQLPGENVANLIPNYYEDLFEENKDYTDWIKRYLKGMPGVMIQGQLVYSFFEYEVHVAKEPLKWKKDVIYRGWDNTGLCPAAVVGQVPGVNKLEILREFTTARLDVVNFARVVVESCNRLYPDAKYIDYGDPAGGSGQTRSTKEGGITSNAELMEEHFKIKVISSENAFDARRTAVENLLQRRDGLLIDRGCKTLINGFVAGYAFPELGRTNTNEILYGEKPIKNKFSHPQDGLQYLVCKLFVSSSPPKKHRRVRRERPSGVTRDSWMER